MLRKVNHTLLSPMENCTEAMLRVSILANTKLFMERLNQALVGRRPDVEQKNLCDRLSTFA